MKLPCGIRFLNLVIFSVASLKKREMIVLELFECFPSKLYVVISGDI